MLLQVQNVRKSFGDNLVLKDAGLEIGEGECHGLIGKNGSGKSTLINMIINLVEPDEGNIRLFDSGFEKRPDEIKKKIGVLPEFNPLVEEFSLPDYLEYIGLIYGLERELIASRTEFLTDYFFEDVPGPKKPISDFSKGMKLKAGVCAALMHKPKLLILDEPFDGLDVFSSNNLVEFLNDYRNRGNSILASSHDILFMDKIVTHVSIIRDEELLNFTKEELIKKEQPFDKQVADIMGYNPKTIQEFK